MAETVEPPLVHARTAAAEGAFVVLALADVSAYLHQDRRDYWDRVFKPIWDNENSSAAPYLEHLENVQKATTDLQGNPLEPKAKTWSVLIAILYVACAYAVQAMKAEEHTEEVWLSVCEANYWFGFLRGILTVRVGEEGASRFAKLGANARHAENRQMKAQVFDWCDANMARYKSMDSAAEAIAGKIVPVSFRTARSWVTEWKKLRSACKP